MKNKRSRKTISKTIKLLPEKEIWTPLFPGTFSAMFKTSHDGAIKSGGSAKVAAGGVQVMGLLMGIVCRKEVSAKRAEDEATSLMTQ